jgi:hypothetical protein
MERRCTLLGKKDIRFRENMHTKYCYKLKVNMQAHTNSSLCYPASVLPTISPLQHKNHGGKDPVTHIPVYNAIIDVARRGEGGLKRTPTAQVGQMCLLSSSYAIDVNTSRTPEEGAHSPKLAKRAYYHHHHHTQLM